ncbi:trypsin-like peptidase domain-containing protein [Candidatus Uhrbacteria bacterium]|nr:trypsin-like peptidase domain-containing protein [Candidatus Uhrbacteria bacterium]
MGFRNQKTTALFLIGNLLLSGMLLGYLVVGDAADAQKKKKVLKVPPTPTPLVIERVIDDESATIRAIERVQPSVVSIVVKRTVVVQSPLSGLPPEILNDPFFNLGPLIPTQPQKKESTNQGTGFFITNDGLILTNKHVVGATSDGAVYTIITAEGKEYSARVVGRDPTNDLAFVRVDGTTFPPAPLGDSANLKTGHTVIAIGNSLGRYQNTVTKGVISGIGRSITANDPSGQSEELFDIIQTDASINPGNSGGPLVNINGEVIGINTAIDQQGRGIGFTIPINTATPIITSMQKTGKILRPRIGVRFALLNTARAAELKVPITEGAYLIKGKDASEPAVLPGGPADKAGLKEGDVILEIQKEKIQTTRTIARVLQKFNVGDTLTLKLWRGGVTLVIPLTLVAVPID